MLNKVINILILTVFSWIVGWLIGIELLNPVNYPDIFVIVSIDITLFMYYLMLALYFNAAILDKLIWQGDF